MRPSCPPAPPPRSRTIALLALALPLLLVATVLLPLSGQGSSGAALAPRGGSGTPETPHPGDGSAPEATGWATASIGPGAPTVLSGGSVVLTASVQPTTGIGPPVVTSYQWSLTASADAAVATVGPIDSASTTFTASSVQAPTEVPVEVQVDGYIPPEISDMAFSVTAAATVTIAPPLVVEPVDLSPDPATPGAAVTLSSTVVGGLPPYDVSFSFGDGSSALLDLPSPGPVRISHDFAAGSYEPLISVNDSSGEHAASSSLSSLIITAHLGAAIVLPAGADEGTTMGISASVGGGTPPYAYLWSDSWGDSSYSGPSWDLVPARAGPLTISLTVTDSDGQVAKASSTTITVAAPPELSLSSPEPEVDVGTPFPLTFEVVGGTPPYQVQWTPGENAATESTELPAPGAYVEPTTFAMPGAISASAELEDALGVEFSTGREVGAVVPLPTLDVQATPSVPVTGQPFLLTGSVAGGVAPYAWSWIFQGPVSSSSPLSGQLSGPGSFAWNGSVPAPGALSVGLLLEDASGGVVSQSLAVLAVAPLTGGLAVLPSRGEVGRATTVTATVDGGEPPYTLDLTCSDGESFSTLLSGAGTATLPLVPRLPGNLSVGVRVQDVLGRVLLLSTTFAVAPAFQLQVSLAQDPIDAGGTETATVLLHGGWAPYAGSLTGTGGSLLSFQGTGTNASFTFAPRAAGQWVLTATASDALAAPAQASTVLLVDPAPAATVWTGGGQTDVGVPLPYLVQASGGTGLFTSVHVDLGDGNTSTTWQGAHPYARPGHYLVNATVDDSGQGIARTAVVPIVVVPGPQVAAQMVGLGADVGRGVAFASQVSFGTPPFAYAWDFGDGTQSALPDPTHAYASPGPYRVTLTVQDGVGAIASAPVVNVTVDPDPLLSIAVNRSAAEAGISSAFQAVVVGGAPPSSVVWDFGDGSSLTGSSLNHTYAAPGTYDVVATSTDAAGSVVAATFSFSVAPALALAGLQMPARGAEVGIPAPLTTVVTGGVAPLRWSWQMGGQFASGPALASWSFDPTSAGIAVGSVQVVDADGASLTVPLSLPVAPALQVNLSLDPVRPEAGAPFQVSALTSGGVGPFAFAWSVPVSWPDPGNRSIVAALVPEPGSYPLAVTVSDALGRSVSSGSTVAVGLPLRVAFPSGAPVADAGLPVALPVAVSGGVGSYTLTLETPFGNIVGSGSTVTFPDPGTFPVEAVAVDQDGVVATADANVTVSPPPLLSWTRSWGEVAVGSALPWSVDVLGGSGPFLLTWRVPGMGLSEGGSTNLTFSRAGTFEVEVVAQDAAGARTALTTNVTAVPDAIALNLTVSATEGLLPFDPFLDLVASGGAGAVTVVLALDGVADGAPRPVAPGLPLILPLALTQAGENSVEVTATDALGARAQETLSLTALVPLTTPIVTPVDPQVPAGAPLDLTAAVAATNASLPPEEEVTWTWWGGDFLEREGSSAVLLSDVSGTVTVELSGVVLGPDGAPVQNLTLPVPVRVLPGPAQGLRLVGAPGSMWAGMNASIQVESVDVYGNLNGSLPTNVSWGASSGPEDGPAPATLELVDGVGELQLDGTRAGIEGYTFRAPGWAPVTCSIVWTANPSLAVLRLVSFEHVGSSLLLNISARDVYGNALSGIEVTALVPGGPSANGTAVDGNLSLLLPGAAGAPSVELLGPDGAQTEVAFPSPGDPAASTTTMLLLALLLGALLSAGLFLAWWRGRGRSGGSGSGPTPEARRLEEAQGALEDLIEHLPGEDRASLLRLAQEHGIPRPDAEEALVLLEQSGRAVREEGEEGVERWHPAPPGSDGPPGPRGDGAPAAPARPEEP